MYHVLSPPCFVILKRKKTDQMQNCKENKETDYPNLFDQVFYLCLLGAGSIQILGKNNFEYKATLRLMAVAG